MVHDILDGMNPTLLDGINCPVIIGFDTDQAIREITSRIRSWTVRATTSGG
jgi:hypothetical protein